VKLTTRGQASLWVGAVLIGFMVGVLTGGWSVYGPTDRVIQTETTVGE